jgi:NhaC family Na+:H+ antiporter
MENALRKEPSLLVALFPILVLILLLFTSIYFIWGGDSLDGANQMALLFSTCVAMFIGWRLGFSWKSMFEGVTSAIHSALPAMIILLLIGALAGTWLISGIVPTMIYYGLKILNPTFFLVSACIISAIVSLATGSSWSTIATVGVALLGIGQAMDVHSGLIAGSIISGAYFGDKMSPMSDTTNLAPAVAGTDLFTHIRYMLLTTIPSLLITLLIFLIIGFTLKTSTDEANVSYILDTLESSFTITPWLFIVPILVIVLIIRKVEAIPSLFFGALIGGVFAIIFQPEIIKDLGQRNTVIVSGQNIDEFEFVWTNMDGDKINVWHKENELYNVESGDYLIQVSRVNQETLVATLHIPSGISEDDVFDITYQHQTLDDLGLSIIHTPSSYLESSYRAMINAMTVTTSLSTNNEVVDELLETGGMSGMLNTIWLIICAMCFGGAMEKIGLLEKITSSIVSKAKTQGSLIASTALTCIGFNITASDQYLAIVVPGKMYAKEYAKRGLAPENLSRTLEDSGTVTSVLVPWNTCGAAQANVLGVATGEYFYFCFFNIISPIMTITYGYFGIKIAKLKKDTIISN